MIRALLLALALIAPGAVSAQTPGPADGIFTLPSVRDCGLITRLAPNLIGPGCLQSVNNIYFDQDWSMLRRSGYSAYNLTACTGSQPIRGLWPFYHTDGSRYLLAFSSATMFYSKEDGTCSAITGLTSLSATAEMECTPLGGFIYCTDGVDPVFRTNVTSTASIPSAPQGTLIGNYRNRILIAGVSGNFTQLYLSGELDGTDWNVSLFPSLSTGPVIIDVSGANDGDKVNCLMGQFQNQFYLGRNYDLFAVAGYDNRDFTLRKVSEQIGCIEPKSVQEVNNVLYWMSKRGVEGLSGTQIEPVSYLIDPTIRQIIAATGNSRSQLLTTQADWQSGNLTASGSGAAMSATISPGNVVASTWSIVENSSAFWVLGALVNVSTISSPGYLTLVQGSSGSFINAGGETNSTINWSSQTFVWTTNSSMYGSKVWNAVDNFSCGSNYLTVRILDVDNNVIQTNSYLIGNDQAVTEYSIDLSTMPEAMIKVDVSYPAGPMEAISVPFVRPLSLSIKTSDPASDGCSARWDIDESHLITTGTYKTIRYDTGLSAPIYGPFTVVMSSSVDSPIITQASVSTGATGVLSASLTLTPDARAALQEKRFVIMTSSFSVNSTTNTAPNLSSLSLVAATTGYYITTCVQVSTPTTWGAFNVNAVNNGGSFTFWLSTGPTCGAATATNATWNSQSPNAQIGISTFTTYIASRVLFTLDSGSQTPTLNDIVFNWNSGANRPPVASAQYLDRYYLFYTTNTVGSAKNDHAAVYDYNKKWTLLDDIPAYSAALYLNQLYIGDSNATGKIYQMESGNSDNGSAYTMSFQTADLDMGNPAQKKAFSRAYIFLSAPTNPAQAININCNYILDGSSTTYSLGTVPLSESPEGSGYFSAKMPFPVGQANTGHWISLGCSYGGTDGPIKIYGLKMVYSPMTWD